MQKTFQWYFSDITYHLQKELGSYVSFSFPSQFQLTHTTHYHTDLLNIGNDLIQLLKQQLIWSTPTS